MNAKVINKSDGTVLAQVLMPNRGTDYVTIEGGITITPAIGPNTNVKLTIEFDWDKADVLITKTP